MATFPDGHSRHNLRSFALWVIIVLLLLALFTLFQNPSQRNVGMDISYSQFLGEVDAGRVRDVLIRGSEVLGTYTDGRVFQTYVPYQDPNLISRLYGKGVTMSGQPMQDNVPWFVSLVMSWLPFIVLIVVWIVLSRQMSNRKT
jgi:cell division protease FtsH